MDQGGGEGGKAPPPAADPKPSMMSAIPRKKLPPLPSSGDDGGAGGGPHGPPAASNFNVNKEPAAVRPTLDKKLPLAAGRHLPPKAPPPPAPAARSSSLSSVPARQRLKKMRRTLSTTLPSSAGGSFDGSARPGKPSTGGSFGNHVQRSRSTGSSAGSSSSMPAESSHITKVSDVPLVLRIRGVTTGLAGISDDPFGQRSSLRLPKRSRPVYEEPNESDPDDYLPDDEVLSRKRKKAVW